MAAERAPEKHYSPDLTSAFFCPIPPQYFCPCRGTAWMAATAPGGEDSKPEAGQTTAISCCSSRPPSATSAVEGALPPLFCCPVKCGRWVGTPLDAQAAPCGSASPQGFPRSGGVMGLALQLKVSQGLGREGQATVSITSLQQNYSGHGFLWHVKQKKSLWKLAIAVKQTGTDICNSVNMNLIPIAAFCYKRSVFSRSCNFSYSAQAPRS